IACGVRLIRSDLEWERDVKPKVRELVRSLGRGVPRGTGKGGRVTLDHREMDRVLVEGVRQPLSMGIGVDEDAELCEDGGGLASVPVQGEVARRYLGAMAAAANFARANRHVLTQSIREAFGAVFGASAERPRKGSAPPLGMSMVYDVAHNLAKLEEYEVEGRV